MTTSFNYEQSIWGSRTATLRPSDPAAFRLRQALRAIVALPAGARVLELGCGAGQFIRAIKRYRPDLDCVGSDISTTAIAAAKKFNDGVTYVVQTRFDGNFFDAIIICDVLEHVTDPAAILNEVVSALKPDGIFYAFVPCEGDSLSLWHALDIFGLKRNLTTRFAGHVQFFSRQSLKKLLSDAGFTSVTYEYSEHFFGQILGVLAFNLMARASKRNRAGQLNNEEYFGEAPRSGLMQFAKSLINSLVYFESRALAHLPSPNVHVFARKRR